MADRMTDLLGSLFQAGVAPSSSKRIEHSLGERGVGGEGGLLEQIFGKLTGDASDRSAPSRGAAREQSAPSGGGPLESLGRLATAVLGDDPQSKSLKAGGIGAIVGALFGGGKSSVKGALGGGALALLGSLAIQALQNAGIQPADDLAIDPSVKLKAGLRDPETPQEEAEVESMAELVVRSMINAAKSDGRIDEREIDRILGRVGKDGASPAQREFLMQELRKPMQTDALVREVPNQQVAAQVYAASLLAIEVDTDTERDYLRQLASKLKLDGNVVRQLHAALGVAA